MSLLDRGSDTVTLYPAGPTQPDGTRGPAGAPVTIRCRVQPSTAQAHGSDGYATTDTYRVVARRLPAGPWDRADWDGHAWTVEAAPRLWRGSRRVAHDVLTLRRR